MPARDVSIRLRQSIQSNPDVSIEDIAEATGLSIRSLRRYLNPSSADLPGLYQAGQIAELLGVSLDMLVYGGKNASNDIPVKFQMTTSWLMQKLATGEQQAVSDAMTALIRVITETAVKAGPLQAKMLHELKKKP